MSKKCVLKGTCLRVPSIKINIITTNIKFFILKLSLPILLSRLAKNKQKFLEHQKRINLFYLHDIRDSYVRQKNTSV